MGTLLHMTIRCFSALFGGVATISLSSWAAVSRLGWLPPPIREGNSGTSVCRRIGNAMFRRGGQATHIDCQVRISKRKRGFKLFLDFCFQPANASDCILHPLPQHYLTEHRGPSFAESGRPTSFSTATRSLNTHDGVDKMSLDPIYIGVLPNNERSRLDQSSFGLSAKFCCHFHQPSLIDCSLRRLLRRTFSWARLSHTHIWVLERQVHLSLPTTETGTEARSSTALPPAVASET